MNAKNAMDRFVREIVREVNRKLAVDVADDIMSLLAQNSAFQAKLDIIARDIALEIGGEIKPPETGIPTT